MYSLSAQRCWKRAEHIPDLFCHSTRLTGMRYMACGVLLALATVVAPSAAEDPGRVRAATPTTVTVRGEQDPVRQLPTGRKEGLGAKVVSGLKGTARKTWSGLVSVGGWFLNENDDIPSERERRAETPGEPR